MSSIFSKIIQGEIPCYKIAENQSCFAFLDIHPLRKGHTLVVPKLEVDELFELPEKDYNELMSFARRVAAALKKAVACKRIGSAVVGLEVPHAHLHLIPINAMDDMNFANPKLTFTQEEFENIAESIRENF
jgi:histidine triad (HIT) family protein